ncbi:helix-turn-helix domain-containing protein [Desulfococcus sp.]|uniref:helix-turn-helix domain-containing protein n=1 Tax=Desulfococcus sp. TaxID=2025834 RepID=UPI003593FF22
MNMQEFADKLEITRQCVHHWCTGRARISVRLAKRVRELTGIPLETLLDMRPQDIRGMIQDQEVL